MKKFLAIMLFFTTTILAVDFEFEGDIHFNKPYLFVSLGCNCWQAQALRLKAHSLRDAAFPFDWLFTRDNNRLIKCLDENFKYFNDETCFIRCPGTRTDVENTYYNFIFTHDWPPSCNPNNKDGYKKQLEFIKNKYTRRIKRFNNIRNFNGKVFFIRCFQTDPNYIGEYGWNAQNAINLNNALKRFFPDLNFTLVIVSCTDPNVSEIGNIDGIKEYKITNLTADNFSAYDDMYAELKHSIDI